VAADKGGSGTSSTRSKSGTNFNKPSFKREQRPSFDLYDHNQKSMDERLVDGSLGRRRRGGVSAEGGADSANIVTARASFEARMNAQAGETQKDPATRSMLVGAIEKSVLFSGMTEAQRELIVDVMTSARTMRNEVVIRQGEILDGGAADNFYVVGDGHFIVTRAKESSDAAATADGGAGLKLATTDGKGGVAIDPTAAAAAAEAAAAALEAEGSAAALRAKQADAAQVATPSGGGGGGGGGGVRASNLRHRRSSESVQAYIQDNKTEIVQERQRGDAFGELALMYNVPRQATVTCVSDYATLWALPRQVYRDVTQLEALDSIQSIVETLQSVELLTCLQEDHFNRLIDSFEVEHHMPGERIIRQGEGGTTFYIILKGTVNCLSGEQVVSTLNRCDYFGERALLKDEPRAVHVDAVTPVKCAKIARETFIDILGPLQTLMETQFTQRVLTRVPVLSHLTAHQRLTVVERFKEVAYAAGESIISEGEVGETFFIVKEGEVHCYKDDKRIRTYKSGEYFGERALRLHEPRAATCVAAGACTCVTLSKDDFEDLLGPLQEVLDHNMLKDTLRTAPLFRYLTSAERENVLDAFEFVDLTSGDCIFRQGDPGISFVLLREGEVKLYRDGEEVATKKGGDYFGEKSLLYGVPRECDAFVSSPKCLAAYLDNSAFEGAMGPIADVLKRATDVTRRDDLEEHVVLGVGTFGKVKLVRDNVSARVFAMKIISKAKVIQYNQQEHILSEKNILAEVDHPFIVQLMATFKDDQRLYMVLEYCPGGELFSLLQMTKRLKMDDCVFYAGSVMLAFEYIHELNVIYRDLKPENLLLDAQGYCKICDFGFAKKIKDRTWTLCGTPEYLAPEIIRSKGHGKGVDWWALGVLVFEMAAGYPPFCGNSAMQTYKLILEGNLSFPQHFSHDCKDLVRRLLHPSVTRRLGCLRGGATDVRTHPFFASLNVAQLLRMKLPTPHIPEIADIMDTRNFPFYEDAPDDVYKDDGTGWDDEF
jgi:cGMP-dependent protein kinase